MSQLPSFLDMNKIGTMAEPNITAAMLEGDLVGRGKKPAALDTFKVALFAIDLQNSFVSQKGSLYVPGSEEDIGRLVPLILRNLFKIKTIIPTMDKHPLFMISFRWWWVAGRKFQDKDTNTSYNIGDHPVPYTVITEESVKDGRWRALFDPSWSHRYVSELAKTGKYPLMIWPEHCLDGTLGACLDPVLAEVIAYWAAARKSQPAILGKGHFPQSEFYGPLKPEVEIPTQVGGSINTNFLNILASHDLILVAGEAKSHCVLAGMRQLVNYFSQNQPDVLKRILFLEDCTSPVKHPVIDFEAIANAELKEMSAKHGIQLVKSTDVTL